MKTPLVSVSICLLYTKDLFLTATLMTACIHERIYYCRSHNAKRENLFVLKFFKCVMKCILKILTSSLKFHQSFGHHALKKGRRSKKLRNKFSIKYANFNRAAAVPHILFTSLIVTIFSLPFMYTVNDVCMTRTICRVK